MTSETQNVTPPPPPQAQLQPLVSTPAYAENKVLVPTELQKFFNEATKYTVFTIFALYSLGFLIWHAFLGTYGVSSIGFLQTEYLSAAFCYLFVVTGFAIPPVILVESLVRQFFFKNKTENEKQKPLYLLIYIWFLFSTKLTTAFFPDSASSPLKFKLILGGVLVGILYAVIIIVGHKRWANSKAYVNFRKIDIVAVMLVFYVAVDVFMNHEVDKMFLTSSLLLYVGVVFSVGGDIRVIWKESPFLLRIVLLCVTALILIANIQLFGSSQFGHIPRQVGGGKPESAYLKFSALHSELADSFGIPSATNIYLSSGFVGPVTILLRTDKELILLNNAEQHSPETLTNDMLTSITTNLIPKVVTNETKLLNVVISSKTETLIKTQLVYNVARSIIKNPVKMTAKQVRVDLVDAVIFAK